ncbi:MAG: hypothetical protein GWN71_41810, partial [Gammaproteobacteria bacterium]|nr:hypothetical protein [Gammaproteobacteria bacterium]
CEAIAQVLERHGTAVVARDRNGRIEVLGPVDETARLVFQSLAARGAAALEQIAADGGIAAERARAALEELCARGVVLRNADGYAVVQ